MIEMTLRDTEKDETVTVPVEGVWFIAHGEENDCCGIWGKASVSKLLRCFEAAVLTKENGFSRSLFTSIVNMVHDNEFNRKLIPMLLEDIKEAKDHRFASEFADMMKQAGFGEEDGNG